MARIASLGWRNPLWQDRRGQDLIEYALMAGFVAVAVAASVPGVTQNVNLIFSRISTALSTAAGNGS